MFKIHKPHLSGSIHSGHFMVSRLDDDDEDNNDPADDTSESERDNANSVEIDVNNRDSVTDATNNLDLTYRVDESPSTKNEQLTSWNDLDRPAKHSQKQNQYLTYYTNSYSNATQTSTSSSTPSQAASRHGGHHSAPLLIAARNNSSGGPNVNKGADHRQTNGLLVLNDAANRSSLITGESGSKVGTSSSSGTPVDCSLIDCSRAANGDSRYDLVGAISFATSTRVINIPHKNQQQANRGNVSMASQIFQSPEQQQQHQRKHLQPRHAVTIDTSLTKLFETMSLYYSSNLTSPKWKSFKGLKLRLKNKIRLNNLIWRTWFLQYIRGRRPPGCAFTAPVETDVHKKSETVVLEGKYWKRKEKAIVDEYKKWRIFHKQKCQLHCFRPSSFDWDSRVSNLASSSMYRPTEYHFYPDYDMNIPYNLDDLPPMLEDVETSREQQDLYYSTSVNTPSTVAANLGSSTQTASTPTAAQVPQAPMKMIDESPINTTSASVQQHQQNQQQVLSSAQSATIVATAQQQQLTHMQIPTGNPQALSLKRTSPQQALANQQLQQQQSQQQQQQQQQQHLQQIQQQQTFATSTIQQPHLYQHHHHINQQQQQLHLHPLTIQQQRPLQFNSLDADAIYQQQLNEIQQQQQPQLSISPNQQLLGHPHPMSSPEPASGSQQDLYPLSGSVMSSGSGGGGSGRNEQRRVCHINAEQKRRCNIKNGFDTLKSILPSINQNVNVKISKASMLNKAAAYIAQLSAEQKQQADEQAMLKQQIENIKATIRSYQSQLPASGGQVGCPGSSQAHEMLQTYVRRRTLDNWKFWIFSLIIEPLFETYYNSVNTTTREDSFKTISTWLYRSCGLVSLRKDALDSLTFLSTRTNILNTPQTLPTEAMEAVRYQSTTTNNGNLNLDNTSNQPQPGSLTSGAHSQNAPTPVPTIATIGGPMQITTSRQHQHQQHHLHHQHLTQLTSHQVASLGPALSLPQQQQITTIPQQAQTSPSTPMQPQPIMRWS